MQGGLTSGVALREWGEPGLPEVLLWPGLGSTGAYFGAVAEALPGDRFRSRCSCRPAVCRLPEQGDHPDGRPLAYPRRDATEFGDVPHRIGAAAEVGTRPGSRSRARAGRRLDVPFTQETSGNSDLRQRNGLRARFSTYVDDVRARDANQEVRGVEGARFLQRTRADHGSCLAPPCSRSSSFPGK